MDHGRKFAVIDREVEQRQPCRNDLSVAYDLKSFAYSGMDEDALPMQYPAFWTKYQHDTIADPNAMAKALSNAAIPDATLTDNRVPGLGFHVVHLQSENPQECFGEDQMLNSLWRLCCLSMAATRTPLFIMALECRKPDDVIPWLTLVGFSSIFCEDG